MTPTADTQPPRDRNTRRKARTRHAIVVAARSLFAAQGFEATTVAQIAQAADTAHGSFYNYFRTKDDVLSAVLEDTLAEQLLSLRNRREGTADPAERVSIGHRHLLAAVRADPEWGWLVLRLQIPNRVVEDVLGEDAMFDLRQGIEAGRFAVADPDVALHASGGALLGAMHLILREGLGGDADLAHAEGVLRSFGMAPVEAAEVARRPLPNGRDV